MKKTAALAILITLISTACATGLVPQGHYQKNPADRFGTQFLAREIYRNLRTPGIIDAPTIVTSFVDLNELDKSSVFGRLIAEKMLNELNRQGFHVVEIRRAQDLFIKKSVGEMILTRDINELASITKARTVLAGTYVATSERVIINARLIDIKSPEILSSVSYEVELTEEIENLIRGVSPF